MTRFSRWFLPFTLFLAFLSWLPRSAHAASPEDREKTIPALLKPWEDWVTWDDQTRGVPTPYDDAKKPLPFWPSRLGLQVDRAGGRFDLGVTVFRETWVPLPGGRDAWPIGVKADNTPVPVVEHGGAPAVRLTPGTHRLEGVFRWNEPPRGLPVPREVGLLDLTVDGKPVEAPTWDVEGILWLQRAGAAEPAADKNFLSLKLYAALEDGIPLWLRTEIEVTVSGKSREEDLGTVLPEGWRLAAIESPLPVAVDNAGRMKAQVRAGRWTIRADAFRTDDVREIRYAPDARPAAAEQLVAFRSRPDFRTVEIAGVTAIDVSQTTFPERWRELPVFRWETAGPLHIEERMRGMGQGKPAGLSVARELWLDEGGRVLTFRDRITGVMQRLWRLDAAPGTDLGSVRSDGQGQLITRNPQNAAPGVEIRARAVNLEATGRMARASEFSAVGWRADADTLRVSLNLPPGWRLFALFGADWVQGDWLTAWTLLDLFLLLIFSLAVGRLWGWGAGVLAFIAFGLAYHEPGAPRFVWLALLVPLALGRVVPAGIGQRLVAVGRWVCLLAFVLVLVPFVGRQVQQAIYPQLERVGSGRFEGVTTARGGSSTVSEPLPATAPQEADEGLLRKSAPNAAYAGAQRQQAAKNENLVFDAKTRIQTGPGVPEWTWRPVSFGWNGPVQAGQRVHPVLISLGLERVLTVLRVLLLLALASVLLGARRRWGGWFHRAAPRVTAVSAILLVVGSVPAARAQLPDRATLDTLRARLLEPSDAYPNAADLPAVTLTLQGRRLVLDAEVHVVIPTAVPLPGRLPAWSPVAVTVDDQPAAALRREDGYLWVALAPGVHRVRVEGQLPDVTDWEWTFQLRPRQVKIDAPGWTHTGVRADGVPEGQVFFTREEKATAGAAASYDRNELQPVVIVDRQLELGLAWQVRSTARRLTPLGKAVALRVPLLPGENVFSANAVTGDGFIEVRLGAQEESFSWESGLATTDHLKLTTRAGDAWVERWHLVASPVWNVALAGLPPIFEPAEAGLAPVWQPWPGEGVDLTITRPEGVAGATVTVDRATHEVSLGGRQRVSKLSLTVRASLGEDFAITLPTDAEVTSLLFNDKAIPVRMDNGRLVVPLRPGAQAIVVTWKINVPLGVRTVVGDVRLPVESANVQTTLSLPDDRWTLVAFGPQRGPAVRFWGILVCALLAAVALGRLPRSPLRPVAWMLLALGLTQVFLPAALAVVAWLFLLEWRGRAEFARLSPLAHNLVQVLLLVLTLVAGVTLVVTVAEGLLGSPEMFILGNGSSRTVLRWFQPRCEGALPRPGCWTVSVWWYRLLMLGWALWLAASLLRWLQRGWENFRRGGVFRHTPRVVRQPPPLPVQP